MNLTRLITLSLLSACTSSQSQTVSKSGSDTSSPQGPADSAGADEDTAATEDTDTGQDPEPDPVDIELILSLDPDCAMCVTAHIAQEETGLVTIYAGDQGSSLAPWVTFDAHLEDTHAAPEVGLHLRMIEQKGEHAAVVFWAKADVAEHLVRMRPLCARARGVGCKHRRLVLFLHHRRGADRLAIFGNKTNPQFGKVLFPGSRC